MFRAPRAATLASRGRPAAPALQRAFSTANKLGGAFDTIVVGGGCAGVSTANALSKRGQKVLVLEQNRLTSGSTWHAAGLVTTFKGSPTIAELATCGRETYARLTRDGHEIGWHQTGSLGIARSEGFARSALYNVMVGRELGHEHHVYFGDGYKPGKDCVIEDHGNFEVVQKKLHPFMANPDKDFVLAVHSPQDGIVNPADCTVAIAKEAKKRGVTIVERSECVGFRRDESGDGRRITKVKVNSQEHGEVEVECGNVVLAASAWMRGLGRHLSDKSLGIEAELPLAYAPHQYTIFEPIEGVTNALPVVREYNHRYYLKPEVGSFMLGIFEGQPIPTTPDFILERSLTGFTPKSAENEVFAEDLEKAGEWFGGALSTCPVLEETGVHRWLNGPDTHSPDHGFYLGPHPALDNVFVASGFNSQGIQCAPGVGLALSQWVLDGYPWYSKTGCGSAVEGGKGINAGLNVDTGAYAAGAGGEGLPGTGGFKHNFEGCNPGRFSAHSCCSDEWVTFRALECYGGTYDVHYPREQAETCRGLAAKSPFWGKTKAKGGVFGEAYGWERPLYFQTGEQLAEIAVTAGHGLTFTDGNADGSFTPVTGDKEVEDGDLDTADGQNQWDKLSPAWTRGKAVTLPFKHYAHDYKNQGFHAAEKAECVHTRSKCTVFDMSPFGKVMVSGTGAKELVNYAITGNVDKSLGETGKILYSSYLNARTGGIQGDLTVARLADDKFYCVLPAADDQRFFAHLRAAQKDLAAKGLSGKAAKIAPCTNDYSTLAVMGPQSRTLLSTAFPRTDFSNEAFPFGSWRDVAPGVQAIRVSFVGELGWELHIADTYGVDEIGVPTGGDVARSVYDLLFETAGQFSVDLKDGGMFALLQTLRTEKGFVHNGHDTHPMVTPQECGLGFTVDLSKSEPGFVGQDALAARKKAPKEQGGGLLRKRLISFQFDDAHGVSPLGHHTEIVLRDGKNVGYLSSAGYSHHLGAPIALGFVDLSAKGSDEKVKTFVEGDGKYEVELVRGLEVVRVPVKTVLGALVDPAGKRVQGEY